MKKRNLMIVAIVFGAGTLAVGTAAVQSLSSGQSMTAAAEHFLASLDEQQRGEATMDFDDPDRLDWHFVPMGERKGLQIRDMGDEQRGRADDLLRTALSEVGYNKATDIMRLEFILEELERDRSGALRDPERYYFTVFGEPDVEGRWGLSIEGHHLSMNFVVEDGHVTSHTPLFFGANPGIVRDEVEGGLEVGHRVLEAEEEVAFELLAAMDGQQREVVVFAEEAPGDVRSGGDPQAPDTEPIGLAGEQMNDEQLELLRELIDVYLGYMPEDVAAERREEVEQAGYEAVHFAWAGADEPGVGHYYRLQGPTFLVELANTQPDSLGRPANHVHALWRDVRGDFGIHR